MNKAPSIIFTHDPSMLTRRLSLTGLLVFVALAYLNGINGDFQFDDVSNIIESRAIRQFDFTLHSLTRLVPDSPEPSQNRPIAVLSFAVNARLTGLDSLSLHLWNLLIHICNTLLVYLLGRKLLARTLALSHESAHWPSLFASGFWALNPVNTQAVTYLVQRMTSLMTLFFLAACYQFIRARSSSGGTAILHGVSVVILFALALGTKESAVTLPFALLLLEITVVSSPGRFFSNRKALITAGSVSLAAAALALALYGEAISISHEATEKGFNSIQRIMTQPRVLWWYAGVFLLPLPSRLNIDIDFPPSTGLLSPPTTALAALAWMGAAAWAISGLRRGERLGPIAVLWFLLASSVESSFLMLDMAYLHRLYLPMVLPSMWFATLILRAIEAAGSRTTWKWSVKWTGLLPAAIVLLFGAGTAARNSVLASSISLWEDTVAKSPRLARPHYNLGYLYQEQLRLGDAEREYLKAIEIRPDYFRPYANLVNIYMSRGQYSRALPALEKALEHGGEWGDVQFLAGKVYESLGDRERAIESFLRSLDGLLPHYRDEALWKMSVLFRQKNDKRGEMRALRELAGSFGPESTFANQARARLDALNRPGAAQ